MRRKDHKGGGIGSNQWGSKGAPKETQEKMAHEATANKEKASAAANGLSVIAGPAGRRSTSMQSTARALVREADHGTVGAARESVAKIRDQYKKALKRVEESGEKPGREFKKLGKSLDRVDRQISDVERTDWSYRNYHSSFPEATSVYGRVTDRDIMKSLCSKVAENVNKVEEKYGVEEEVADPSSMVDRPVTNRDGVQLPSTQSYEEAAAILGRGFDHSATQMEIDAYYRAGKEPPRELIEHARNLNPPNEYHTGM